MMSILIIVIVHLQTQHMIENGYEEYWFQEIQVESEMLDASEQGGSHVRKGVGMVEYCRLVLGGIRILGDGIDLRLILWYHGINTIINIRLYTDNSMT